MAHKKKPSPDTGKVAAIAVGRGKSEQIRIVLKSRSCLSVWASCCRAVTVFHHRRTKKLFLSVP